MRLTILAFLIVSGVAWGQPAQAPSPPQPLIDKAAEFIKSNPDVSAAILRSAAVSMAAQANAQQATVTPPVPAVAIVPVPPAPVAQSVVVPAELRNDILTLCGILITAGIGAGLTWMRSHFAFMKEVGANAAITSSAQGLGALLEQELVKHGTSLSTVSVNDPTVAAFAQKLIASYPEWGPLVGLTPDIAARKVLGGAIEQSAMPLQHPPQVITETIAPVQPPMEPTAPIHVQGPGSHLAVRNEV